MNNPDSVKIVIRFYEALDALIAMRKLRGVQTFTREYNINRWNFNTVRKNPESGMFEIVWLQYLVRDFGVSANWLLTGFGDMFSINMDKIEPLGRIAKQKEKRAKQA